MGRGRFARDRGDGRPDMVGEPARGRAHRPLLRAGLGHSGARAATHRGPRRPGRVATNTRAPPQPDGSSTRDVALPSTPQPASPRPRPRHRRHRHRRLHRRPHRRPRRPLHARRRRTPTAAITRTTPGAAARAGTTRGPTTDSNGPGARDDGSGAARHGGPRPSMGRPARLSAGR